MAAQPPYPLLREVGLSGLLVTFSDSLTDAANRANLAFRAAIEAEGIAGVVETSSALASTLLSYDPIRLPLAELRAVVTERLASRDWFAAALPQGRRFWRIPVAFGGEHGPQLAEAAALAGLTEGKAVAEIAATRLRVMALGFAPGLPYLGTMPDHWNMPRQDGLTAQVPAGSVVTAIRQFNIFTNATPTGWRLIGQSAFRNFRPELADPFAFRPGDEVSFVPIGAGELADIRAGDRAAAGGALCEAIP
ncbi:5-oxoprolinase subunit B family protein [Pseudogemmobacter humi]|uniref:Kinase A inhibitor n=1 Tax=Pseudogemmobacter humi TaxID=2483812 RepID=A0A3P5X377_9RHOB|nr:carboxyltransferase domain-containing protein [Pseudogemmobacter humi]VDC28661.1 Kinase A inhibitor [Pseudogemmobacter humi]